MKTLISDGERNYQVSLGPDRRMDAGQKPAQVVNGMPRRCQTDLCTASEKAIAHAMFAVECTSAQVPP